MCDMEDNKILKQIKDENQLGYDYMLPAIERYKKRLLKWMPQEKWEKMNINLIANTIDVKIASFFSNGVKVKFISKQGWIWEEEADNLNSVASFDQKEWTQTQLEYQIEQDSEFFGVGICNRVWFDGNKVINKRRAINPLSCRPDPLPSQTGQFDGQNYRFFWFNMLTTVYDMKGKYDNTILNEYFQSQYDSDEQSIRDAYTTKWWYWAISCDNLENNFSLDVHTHYTIVEWYKWKFVTDVKFSKIFDRVKLDPVLREEKLDPLLVPRPIMLNYSDPQRWSFLWWSICDKLEDKQNAMSIIMNANLIKTKKEATGWDFLVNSRLIKNQDEFKKKSTNTRYFFIDEDAIGTQPIQNAMFELPQSQIKWDTWAMMNAIQAEANKDSKIDQMQSWIVPDKTMTKAEQQAVQGNANNLISLQNSIKARYYQEYYFQRWRGYLENMKEWQKKFALLNSNFEWKWVQLKKDQFVTKQIPYIMIGSIDDINAINEKQKSFLNLIYPQVSADPTMDETSKRIFKRMYYKVNGIQNNTINSFLSFTPAEQYAKGIIEMVDMDIMPKWIFDNPNTDYKTLRIYMQKAGDWEIKDKILNVIRKYLIDKWQEEPQEVQWQQMANAAANIQMSQAAQIANPANEIISRTGEWQALDNNQSM